MVSTFIGLLFNISVNYELVVRRGWGIDGCAITVACQSWVLLLSLTVTIMVRRCIVRRRRGDRSIIGKTDSGVAVQYTVLDIDSPLPADSSEGDNYTERDAEGGTCDEGGDFLLSRPRPSSSSATAPPSSSSIASRTAEIDAGTEDELDNSSLDLDPEDNWPAPSIEVLRDWVPFLRLGIPGALSLFIEWGSFEMAAGIAGKMSTAELATHSLYMQTAGIFYMFPLAIANSVSILLGNYIGRQEYERAKELISLGLTTDFLIGFISGSLLLVLRKQWGFIFSDDPDVDRLVDSNMLAMFLYSIVDASKCVSLNILRSSGSPVVTVFFNFFACVGVLLPLGYYLGIQRHYGVFGLWIAMSVAWFLCTVVYLALILSTDWEKQNFVKEGGGAVEIDMSHALRKKGGEGLAGNEEDDEL